MGTDVTFQGVSMRTAIDGLSITNITRPTRPERERNKVVIPGQDGTYDFGNNRVEDYIITVEVVITADTAAELQTRSDALQSYLDGKGTLIFSDALGATHTAQVYDEVLLVGNANARFARGLIVFECDSGGA